MLCVCGQASADPIRVRHRIRLQVLEKQLQYAVDDSTDFNNLSQGQTFLTSGPITVTIRGFNPLTTNASVTVDDAADPTHETLGTLVKALLDMSSILGADVGDKVGAALKANSESSSAQVKSIIESLGDPRVSERFTKSTATPSCTGEQDEAAKAVTDLYRALNAKVWSEGALKEKTDEWVSAINEGLRKKDAMGADVLTTVARLVQDFIGSKDEAHTLSGAITELQRAQKVIEDALNKKAPSPCDESVSYIYALAELGSSRDRLQRFVGLRKVVTDIHTSLASYAEPAKRDGTFTGDLVVRHSVEPTASAMRTVGVKVSTLKYDVSTGSIAVSTDIGPAATMVIRRYSSWVPEIGVGVTFSNVTRPSYGTAMNDAGKIVIAEGQTDSSSIDPTIMVNFSCGFCGTGPLRPMFQVGASTSTSSPAVFIGAGIRLAETAKGAFAIGAGFVLPWARQLKDDSPVGTIIDGTADLDAHLEWRRLSGTYVYWNLQYKF
jgi:hypothetical protein